MLRLRFKPRTSAGRDSRRTSRPASERCGSTVARTPSWGRDICGAWRRGWMPYGPFLGAIPAGNGRWLAGRCRCATREPRERRGARMRWHDPGIATPGPGIRTPSPSALWAGILTVWILFTGGGLFTTSTTSPWWASRCVTPSSTAANRGSELLPRHGVQGQRLVAPGQERRLDA